MQEKSVKVLVVATTTLGFNGITNVILNYYEHIDRHKVHFDVVLTRGAMDWVVNKIKSYGGDIYEMPCRDKKPLTYIRKLKKLILDNNYSVVHVHGNSGTMAIDIYAAKIAKTKVRIAHSHNTTGNYKIVHKLLKPLLNSNRTHALACSDLAGKWAFNNNFEVIKNGIDTTRFIYNQEIRDRYRKNLDLENCFVIGHIGHMSYQKNHEFLIDIFFRVYKNNKNARLLLIGDGKNREMIESQINDLSLSEAVIMLGKRDDVSSLLQAMDVFLLPSRHEGLGIVNIEAQATGLKCVVADTIPQEAKVSENIHFLSLNSPIEDWTDLILSFEEGYVRKNSSQLIIDNGYDIRQVVRRLESIYSH
ncbi:glycosyltransferase family 1 protein [Bacillus sp. FJAT-27986]|uniref:glycosyltransferase family 1 protein n=1 Tax=Bacillus sp. FJAT-27986 TaxID=1743146 RepID=UPI00080AD917|nr:glycosyltransferase family 1 protein [Bacillus sp. FJAT-27986]OCA84623.1 hypothetical protein A8L44_09480 [Bacillus sp. FJAT-27986]